MSKALLISFLILGSLAGGNFKAQVTDVTGDVEDAAEFVVGILAGFEIDIGEQAVVDCVTDVADILGDLRTGISDFKQKDEEGIKSGLKEVGLALEAIPSTLNLCRTIQLNQSQKIEDALAIFKSPLSLIYHVGEALVVDGNQIYDDINNGISDWEAGDFEKSGQCFGEALFKVLAPTKEAMIGLFQGFKVQTNFPDVIKCLEDVYGLAKGIAGAVADFAAKNYAKGLADLTSILAQLPSAISDCKNAKDGEMILRALEIIKHPLSVEYEQGVIYKINGIDIQEDMDKAVDALVDNDWRGSFYYVGRIINKLGH